MKSNNLKYKLIFDNSKEYKLYLQSLLSNGVELIDLNSNLAPVLFDFKFVARLL